MKINRTGITRIVIELNSVVIKTPNFTYSWQHFLKGLVANIHENQTWKYTKSELLCPVVWSSWGGWVLIMKKADTARLEKEIEMLPYKMMYSPEARDNWFEYKKGFFNKWIDAGFGGDDKVDNYGYYQDRIVKIDYGQITY